MGEAEAPDGEGLDGRSLFVYDGEASDPDFAVGVLKVKLEGGEDETAVEVIFDRRQVLSSCPPGSMEQEGDSSPLAPRSAGESHGCGSGSGSGSRSGRGGRRRPHEDLVGVPRPGFGESGFHRDRRGRWGWGGRGLRNAGRRKWFSATLRCASGGGQGQVPVPHGHRAHRGRSPTPDKGSRTGWLGSNKQSEPCLPRFRRWLPPGTTAEPASPCEAPTPSLGQPRKAARGDFGLDAGVVRAALVAGVDEASLQDMGRLLAGNQPKLLQEKPAKAVVPKTALEESECEDDDVAALGGGAGRVEPLGAPDELADPVTAAVLRLTTCTSRRPRRARGWNRPWILRPGWQAKAKAQALGRARTHWLAGLYAPLCTSPPRRSTT